MRKKIEFRLRVLFRHIIFAIRLAELNERPTLIPAALAYKEVRKHYDGLVVIEDKSGYERYLGSKEESLHSNPGSL